MRVGILTVSDGCFHGTRDDRSGELIVAWCGDQGYEIVGRATVPDETAAIVPPLLDWCDRKAADLVLTTGGTGFGPRDVTPEATACLLHREAPGVADAIRRAGEPKTLHAVLSRGLVGIRGHTVIVNLPGSPGGVTDGLDALARVAPHAVSLAKDEPSPHHPSAQER